MVILPGAQDNEMHVEKYATYSSLYGCHTVAACDWSGVREIRSRYNGETIARRFVRTVSLAGERSYAKRDRTRRLIPHCVGRDAIIASYVCITGPHEAHHATRVFAGFVTETVRVDGKIDTPNNTVADPALFSEPIDRSDCSIVIISDVHVRRTLIRDKYRYVDIGVYSIVANSPYIEAVRYSATYCYWNSICSRQISVASRED